MATQDTGAEIAVNVVGVSTEGAASPAKKQEEGREGKKSNNYDDGRERLKRHRNEVAGRVRVPELWGQEDLLKEWSDCSNQFDASLSSSKILSARAALLEEGRKRSANMNMNIMKASARLRIDSRC